MTGTAATPDWTVGCRRMPEPGESLSGFMARTAAAEGLPNTLELTSIAGAVWSRRPELSRGEPAFADLAACLRVDVAELEAMSYPIDPGRPDRRVFGGVSIDRRFIVHDERRFSPTTLSRQGIHLKEWQLRPFPFCRESWEFLASRCPDPDCGSRQRWYHASGVDLCDKCGEPLVLAKHGKIPPEQREALEAALDLVHPDADRRRRSIGRLPAMLNGLDPGDLLDLLVAVAGVHDPEIRCASDHLVFRMGTEPAALAGAIADAWRTLTTWPEGFMTLAADRIAIRNGRFGDGNRGATMRLLDVVMEQSAPPILVKVVTDLRQAITETVSMRGMGSKAAGRLPFLTSTALVALRRQGVLRTVFALDGNEPQPYLDRHEVEALSEALRSSVPLNHAAAALGIADHGVEQLETRGLVTFERSAGTMTRDGSHRVTSSSLGALTARLVASAAPGAAGWMKLPIVVRMIGGRSKPWGPIVEGLLGGRLRYAIAPGPQPLLRRIVIDPADARRLAEMVYMPPGDAVFLPMMSKNDALEVLNLHARHAGAALKHWPSAKTSDRTVPVAEVLELSRRLVSLGELVARTGRPVKSVVAMLTDNGVPVDAPWSPRDEAEAALFGARHGYSASDIDAILKLQSN